MAEFPALKLWTDAYLGDTTHLTTTEHGAYLLLLIAMWRTKDKALPNDDRLLTRYAKLTSGQWARMRPVIMDFFTVDGDRITQGRLTDEANAVKQHSRKQSDSSKARWRKEKEKVDAAVEPAPCQADPSLSLSLSLSHKKEPTTTTVLYAPSAEQQAVVVGSLFERVLVAVGLNPADVLPAHWLNPGAIVHVNRWREIKPGLTDDEIVAVAEASRKCHATPPDRPKALDREMASMAAEKAAPPLEPGKSNGRYHQKTKLEVWGIGDAEPLRPEPGTWDPVAEAQAQAQARARASAADVPDESPFA